MNRDRSETSLENYQIKENKKKSLVYKNGSSKQVMSKKPTAINNDLDDLEQNQANTGKHSSAIYRRGDLSVSKSVKSDKDLQKIA